LLFPVYPVVVSDLSGLGEKAFMLILRKTTIINLILIAMLLSAAAVCAETVEYDGLIEPYVVVNIGAPVEGVVAEVTVDRSNSVKKGQILVEMESSVEQAALEKAQAMATFDGEIGLQKTQLAFAKRSHNRFRKLKAIANHDKDQAATEIIRVGHRLKQARENRTLAKFELKKARAILNRCSIKSPISGVVVAGEYVNSQPLLRVAQIDPLRVEVIVPAQMFGRIIPGMTATIVPELPQYGEQTATVTIVDKVIDAASSTFGVRLELPNAEQQMPSGLRCLVRFEIDENADEVTARIDPDQANSK
jgi:RND family efflux transporter MFP subunit